MTKEELLKAIISCDVPMDAKVIVEDIAVGNWIDRKEIHIGNYLNRLHLTIVDSDAITK